MLPVLDSNNALDQQYLDYLTALAKAGFSGDIETQYSSRLAMATDNSIYQNYRKLSFIRKTFRI